ncbi:anti-sigma factor [Microlunatus flavus]|uniref:Regulator of SigK n=1 Tax=Microlunatus flavus TaxID=1036181 RepID=A0A1H9LXN5_9ACTN|nr:anti-sigma factor [Microlunatus flavus]SER16226.1 Putative zinc-finger [Microlunatus flavus]
MSDHDDAAAYALDALDAAERAQFEEHLAGCAQCRDEVAELHEAAAALVLAEPVPLPPPSLRASVLDAITGVEQLPPLAAPTATGSVPSAFPAAPAVAAATSAAPRRALEPVADPVVDELALRRASRRARALSVLVAAVTVVALALGFTVWGLVRQQEPPVAGPAPTVTVPQVDPSLLAAPDARIYATTVNGAAASFVVSKSLNRAAFVSSDLPSAGAGNVFHLWTLKGKTVRPDAVFSTSGQTAAEFTGPVDDSTNLAINVEPAGTSPQTPTTPVLGIVEI